MFKNLTKKQIRGFKYAAKLRNDANVRGRTDWDAEEIATEKLIEAGNALYEELNRLEWQLAKQKFDSSTKEQQAVLRATLKIPQIVEE